MSVVGACGSGDSESTGSPAADTTTADTTTADTTTVDATGSAADDVPVDPQIYRPAADADQYYFQTESGNVYCGISTTTGAGCQTTGSPLPEGSADQLAGCWHAPGGPSSGARVFGNSAAFMCFNQAVFIGPPPPAGRAPEGATPDTGGWEILPAGGALVIDTYACEAERDAVTCRQGTNGFTIGPEVAEIF